MPKERRLPDGKKAIFPDSMSDNEIDNAISKYPNGNQKNQYNQEKNTSDEYDALLKKNLTVRSPLDFMKDILVGMGKTGENIAELGLGDMAQKPVERAIPRENPNPLVQAIGAYGPFAVGGSAAAGGIRALGPSFMKKSADVIGHGLAGAGFGAIQPEAGLLASFLGKEEGPGMRVVNAIEGAIPIPGLEAIVKAANALRPSKIFRGQLSPEELAKNLSITRGTPTGLGDVIQSPFLKKTLENQLPSIPFSGAEKQLQEMGATTYEKAEDALATVLGKNSPEDVVAELNQSLHNIFEKVEKEKTNIYKSRNAIADKNNIRVHPTSFQDAANEYKEAIEGMEFLKQDPETLKLLRKLTGYVETETSKKSNIVNASGKPFKTDEGITFNEATLLKSKMDRYSKEFQKSPEPEKRGMAKIFGKLGGSIGKDIDSIVEKNGNEELKNAHHQANKYYKEKFSPFLEKELYKFVSGKADPDTLIQAFIKTGQRGTDRAHSTSKVTHVLTDREKRLLGYAYLDQSRDKEGVISPSMLKTKIDKLGKRQFETLFEDPEVRKKLMDYSKLAGMNTEGLTIMFNPKNGARNSDAIVKMLTAQGMQALGGGIAGGLPGALAGVAIPIASGKAATHLLTSEKFRENLINAMLENKNWSIFNKPKSSKGKK
jgi:hypothetical protein